MLWGYGGTGRALRRALLAHGKWPSHVVSVGGAGPREEIRATLAAMGFRDTHDFVCAA